MTPAFPTSYPAFRATLCRQAFSLGLLLVLLLPAPARAAISVSLSDDGAVIEVGAGGPVTLYYPTLTDDKGTELHKIEGKNVKGKTAVVSYEGGAKLELTVADTGELTYHFSEVPKDVTQWKLDSILPLAFAKGGKWKIGTVTKPFPESLSKDPHLYAVSATACEVAPGRGGTLTFSMPMYSYMEVIDNRAWQWNVFDIATHVPSDGYHWDFEVKVAATGL